MTQGATIDAPIDEAILDELVPPPGPRWRRALLWIAFVGIVGASTWAVTSGTVVPQVEGNVQAWGGAGPVGVTVSVTNTSRVAIELVDGPRTRPGLRALGVTTGPLLGLDMTPARPPGDPFPIRLEPRETLDMTFWYRVTDCDAVAAVDPADDTIDLEVRIADGPASWITTERSIDADMSFMGQERPSWSAEMAQHACPR